MKRRLAAGVAMVMTLVMVGGAAPVSATGDEGCTPGYWKQQHHFDSWPSTANPDEVNPADRDIKPNNMFYDWFKVNLFPGKTLLQVLWQGGGGKYALGRHAVAGFLNAHSDSVMYDRMPDTVVRMVRDAYYKDTKWAYNAAKDRLEGFNEMGCPLN